MSLLRGMCFCFCIIFLLVPHLFIFHLHEVYHTSKISTVDLLFILHTLIYFILFYFILFKSNPTGKDRTLFLRLLEAEKSGLITVTVEPPMMLTSTGWEKDASPFLMNARFAMQVLPLSYSLLFFLLKSKGYIHLIYTIRRQHCVNTEH